MILSGIKAYADFQINAVQFQFMLLLLLIFRQNWSNLIADSLPDWLIHRRLFIVWLLFAKYKTGSLVVLTDLDVHR